MSYLRPNGLSGVTLPHRGSRGAALGCSCGGRCGGTGVGDAYLHTPRGRLSGLGDDAPAAPPPDQVQLLTQIRDVGRQWVAQDQKLRLLQISATLAIPLAAAIWRVILHKKQGTPLL